MRSNSAGFKGETSCKTIAHTEQVSSEIYQSGNVASKLNPWYQPKNNKEYPFTAGLSLSYLVPGIMWTGLGDLKVHARPYKAQQNTLKSRPDLEPG